MKQKIISPLLAILAILSTMPGIAFAQSNTVAVSPSANAGSVGDFFTVDVTIDDVVNLVGYDVTLQYDTLALDISSVSLCPDLPVPKLCGPYDAAAMAHFHVVSLVSDATGEVRSAVTALGGGSLSIGPGAPESLMSVTFEVIAAIDSPLDLVGVALACKSGADVVDCPATVVSGGFFVPPNVMFDVSIPPSHVIAPSNTVRFLSKGEDFVMLNGFVQLDPMAPRSGFGGIHYTVQDPDGNLYFGDSDIAFMFPGGTAAVQGTVSYGNVLGTYKVFVTVLQCTGPDVSSCVTGDTSSAKFFKVHF